LVGAGLTALLRTDPQHPHVGSDVAARAAALTRSAADRVREWPESRDAEHFRELASDTKNRVVELGSLAHETLTGLPETATAAAQHGWSETVRQGRSLASAGSTTLRDAFKSDQRDNYLLGFAAVALAAAVGMTAARSNQHARSEQRAVRAATIRKTWSEDDKPADPSLAHVPRQTEFGNLNGDGTCRARLGFL
jgi:hypothetical protein